MPYMAPKNAELVGSAGRVKLADLFIERGLPKFIRFVHGPGKISYFSIKKLFFLGGTS